MGKRKMHLKITFLGLLLVVLASVMAACGGGEESSGEIAGLVRGSEEPSQGVPPPSEETLHVAIASELGPLDPATYYDTADGLLVINAAYQGLVAYKPDSTELVGVLAEDWSVSEDGLTYTFKLRPNVKFHSGAPFDSSAAKAALQRTIDMEGGPSYMLGEVERMDTPSPDTLVVHLAKPVAAFLSYLASPYGPKMVDVRTAMQNEVDGDLGAKWLATHDAGTGPYEFAEIKPATSYTLDRFPAYWGEEPYFAAIEISVTGDYSAQRLKLQEGDLDIMPRGVTVQDVKALVGDPNLEVRTFPTLAQALINVNPYSQLYRDPQARADLAACVASLRGQWTESLYGNLAEPSKQFYPPGMLPGGTATVESAEPAEDACAGMSGADGARIQIGSGPDPNDLRGAQLLQVELQRAGADATIRQIPSTELGTLASEKGNHRPVPDLILQTSNPDSLHPDTWARIWNYADGSIGYFDCRVPAGDKALDAALVEPNPEKSKALSVKAAEAYRDSNCWIPIADVFDVMPARADLAGYSHQLTQLFSLDLTKLYLEEQ